MVYVGITVVNRVTESIIIPKPKEGHITNRGDWWDGGGRGEETLITFCNRFNGCPSLRPSVPPLSQKGNTLN